MDPLQWMGAVRMRVQTADKNITIIHTTPVHQFMSCEAKICVFARNKCIIKIFFNFKQLLKYESSIYNIASSNEKVILSESGENYAQIKCLQVYKWNNPKKALNKCFYQQFGLSFWRHPFTAEDPLVSKWCNAKFLQICSDEKPNSSTCWMAWVNF